jgi:hypothetical protein
MYLTMERVLSPAVITSLYPTYLQAWDPLLVHAAARHVLSEAEFAHEMTDERIEKYLVRTEEGGDVLGLTTLTNDLSAIPWINIHHYVTRYPDAAARGALFYLGYTFVDRSHRRSNILLLMAEQVNRRLSAAAGVVGFDICAFNNEHGIGRRVARLFSASDRIDSLDTQSYYAADYREVDAPSSSLADEPNTYDIVTLANRPDLTAEIWDLLSTRWPAFTLVGRPGHSVDLERLLLSVPDQQVLLFDAYDALCGVGLSVPLHWNGTIEDLPMGWDDAINQSAALLERGGPVNTMCALSVTIAAEASGHGLAAKVMAGLNQVAYRQGATSLITPVRPSLKTRYPLIPVDDYLTWQTESGECFDPWVRLHLRLGAEVLGVAKSSMTVTGSVSEWEGWLGIPLPGSGEYAITGGLVPLQVDRGTDLGTYREPNVWVRHQPTA